jgi:glycine hydroxymethyltransferase
MTTSGIRVGTAAMTTRGLNEADFVKVVNLVDRVLMNHDNEEVVLSVRNEVNEWMKWFPLFKS